VSSDTDGYVHTPEYADAADSAAAERAEDDEPSAAAERQGTVLLVAVVLATLVIPGVIYLYPALLADRVPFLVAMLVLPFIPALLLGIVAVWSMNE
jgi:hypothetical protein